MGHAKRNEHEQDVISILRNMKAAQVLQCLHRALFNQDKYKGSRTETYKVVRRFCVQCPKV